VLEPPGGGYAYDDPATPEFDAGWYAWFINATYIPNFPGSQTITGVHENWFYWNPDSPPRPNPLAPYARPVPDEFPQERYRQADNTAPRDVRLPRRESRTRRVTGLVTPAGARTFRDDKPWAPPRPPSRKHTREKKTILTMSTNAGVRLFGELTEAIDLVDALWKALMDKMVDPKNNWLKEWYERERKALQPGWIKEPTAWTKAKLIYDFWDYIDPAQAMMNIVTNEIMDRVAGKLGKGAAKSYGAATGRSIGIGTGPAL
jgi:hypothetical protein